MNNLDFKEGDLVEVTHGETMHRVRLAASDNGGNPGKLFLSGVARTPYLDHLTQIEGWAVTLIERPEPKVELPTEAGFYLDRQGDVWKLFEGGDWECQVIGGSGDVDPANYFPFTRLESRAGTAKAVLRRIKDLYSENFFDNSKHEWNKVAAEFGVAE